jgi:chitin synthase
MSTSEAHQVPSCLRPNNTALPNQVDLKLLRHQMGSIGIAELARRLDGEWSIGLNYKELWDRVSKGQHLQEHLSRLAGAIWSDKLEGLRIAMGFTDRDFAIGKTKVRRSSPANYATETDDGRTGLPQRLRLPADRRLRPRPR